MPKKTKFSIYVGTRDATRENILSASLREKIDDGRVSALEPTETPIDGATAYWVESEPRPPKWRSTLAQVFQLPAYESNSAAALVVMNISTRVVVLCYGYASKLLNDRYLEHDFGIRVAANAIVEDEVTSLQKSNVANAMKQFAQSPMRATFGTFGGQGKFEIIRRLSGTSSEKDIDTLIGSTGVSFTTEKSIDEVVSLANRLVALYESDRYKQTAFSVIDDFKPILNPADIQELDEALIAEINQETNDLELAVPQLRFEDVGYVKLSGVGVSGEYPDISLDLYKSTFDADGTIEGEDLESDKIAFFTDEHRFNGNWRVKKCLVGYITHDEKRYVINEGKYYLPSETLFETINNYFATRRVDTDGQLGTFDVTSWEIEKGKPRADGTRRTKPVPRYEREETFNARVADNSPYILFDQEWHRSENGEFNKLEVCDLYDPEGLRFIHVKRTSRKPAMVAYLFDQGLRAANLWSQEAVKEQFIDRVRDEAGQQAADALPNARPQDLTIEFAIADYPNDDGIFTIPFLAKLAFETKIREIESRGFSSRVSFIPLDRPQVIEA